MKITPELLTKAWQLFTEGNSLSAIAKQLKLSRSGLTDRLKEEYGYDTFEAVKQSKYKTTDMQLKEQSEKQFKPKITEKTEIADNLFDNSIEESSEEIDISDLDYLITSKEITLMYKGTTRKFSQNDELFSLVKNACINEDYQYLLRMFAPTEFINKYVPELDINVTDMTVNVNGTQFPFEYANLIINELNKTLHQKQDPKFQNLLNFFARCIQFNIESSIVIQMYEFLKHNDIVILPNGSIQGWKYIAKTDTGFKDSYTKSISNEIGTYVTMERDLVTKDPNITCAAGLHVGSWEYVCKQDYIAQVIVNPEDVVSVPIDYSGQKLRCCKYYVHDILEKPKSPNDFIKPIELN